jgi:hypothetical protein
MRSATTMRSASWSKPYSTRCTRSSGALPLKPVWPILIYTKPLWPSCYIGCRCPVHSAPATTPPAPLWCHCSFEPARVCRCPAVSAAFTRAAPASARRGFAHLDSIARRRLVDGLCSNLSVLCLSVSALVAAEAAGDDGGEREAAAAGHRNALHAYVFFLSWLYSAAEAEVRAAAAAAPGAVGAPALHTQPAAGA